MTGPEVMIVMAASEIGGEALSLALARLRWTIPAGRYWGRCALINAALALIDLAAGVRWIAAGVAIAALIALALWWWNRRKDRKRATGLLGAKSRALRDALVRKARELTQPRPVHETGSAR
jgi:Flp pilus assembly protein TadB